MSDNEDIEHLFYKELDFFVEIVDKEKSREAEEYISEHGHETTTLTESKDERINEN